MKRVIVTCAILVSMLAASIAGEELTRERQMDIIASYMYAAGQKDKLPSDLAASVRPTGPIKCGTPALLDFIMNLDKLDVALLQSLNVMLPERPTYLSESVDSPSGLFRIHYTTGTTDRVPSLDYVNSVAAIFDEVYAFMVDTLGYRPPPSDGFYPSGDGDPYDVYLRDLEGIYGQTTLDSAYIDGPGTTRGTSFMDLDNDYAEIPTYRDRPLDAVRVTAAHEFFHAIHFGIDFTEGEISPDNVYRSWWMEMSATWMEEAKYDDINDYYFYLPYFFNSPWNSIEQFRNPFDLHPYASMLFPLFLSEKFDRDVIREIWVLCGSLGPGNQFLTAANHVIDSVTGSAETFGTAFREFAVWTYFTGSRGAMAPDGYGFSERSDFDAGLSLIEFSEDPLDSIMAIYSDYSEPVDVSEFDNLHFNPDHNAAFYLKLDELRTIRPDTSYWVCNSGSFPTCLDSTEVSDPSAGYDIMHIDSTFAVGFALDGSFPYDWGFTTICQFEQYPDSAEVVLSSLERAAVETIDFELTDIEDWRSITLILTPASAGENLYNPYSYFSVAYSISGEISIMDSSLIDLPASAFAPYPNPTVVSQLVDPAVMFKYQVPTDSASLPVCGERFAGTSPSVVVDIFTVSGEHVCTLEEIDRVDDREGTYWVRWNLQNARGKEVASGVYVAFARLYCDADKQRLLTEDKTKVAIIR